MTATANSYLPDKGEITATIDAAGATATGLTAGTYTCDIVVRKFSPTQEPERKVKDTFVTGGTIRKPGDLKGSYIYDLVIVDDYMLGATGELGTTPNEFTVVELFKLHMENLVSLGELTVTPAGSSTGMIEQTITAPEVEYVSGVMIDADSEDLAERTIRVSFPPSALAEAAHA